MLNSIVAKRNVKVKRKRREKSSFEELIKTGIVYSNAFCVLIGVALMFLEKGESIFGHLWFTFWVVLSSSLVVAGSCALNNYIDRDIDKVMNRTKTRPSVTGFYGPKLILFIGFSFVFLGLFTLYLISPWSFGLAVFGSAGYVVFYSLIFKRKTWLNTIIGAVPGAVPVLIGYTSGGIFLSLEVVFVFLLMFIWQIPHFYAIAIRRKKDYEKANVPMISNVKGFTYTRKEMTFWVLLLNVPLLFLSSFGVVFLGVMFLLNALWLYYCARFDTFKSEEAWATFMFFYSIAYFLIIFTLIFLISAF